MFKTVILVLTGLSKLCFDTDRCCITVILVPTGVADIFGTDRCGIMVIFVIVILKPTVME